MSTNSEFCFSIIKEGGYKRLYVTHPHFKGRVKKRIGKNDADDDQYFKYKIKYEFDKHFQNNEITKSSVTDFVNQYVSLNIKGKTDIFNFVEDFIQMKRDTHNEFTEKKLAKTTVKSYESSIREFQRFLIRKRISPHPSAVNKKLLDDFYYSLRVSGNTKVKMHRRSKAYISFLSEDKGISIDLRFKDSKFNEVYDNQCPREDDIALTNEQIRKLIELRDRLSSDDSPIPKPISSRKNLIAIQRKQYESKKTNLILSLDCFLFMVGTGQYHSDIVKSEINIIEDDGHSRLDYRRAKNNSLCKAIPIGDDDVFLTKTLISQYKIKSGTNFPLNLSDTHFAKYLKIISELAGLDIILKNKMGRKTFASTLYYDREMPIHLIQVLLGHKDVDHTKHYLRIKDKKLADEIRNRVFGGKE